MHQIARGSHLTDDSDDIIITVTTRLVLIQRAMFYPHSTSQKTGVQRVNN